MAGGKLHYGWVVVGAGLLVTIGAHGFGRMSYTLILPAMKDGLSLDYAELGLLGTGNFVGYLIMAVAGGLLAARWGSRLVITISLGLMGLTMILTGLAHSFAWAWSMRFLTGLGNGGAYVPAMALGSAWFAANRRGFATGIVSAGIGGGTMIAGILVPLVLTADSQEGWRQAWYILGGAVLAIAALAACLVRARPQEMGLSPVGVDPASEAAATSPTRPGGLAWGSVFRVGAVWYLGLVYMMYGFSYIIYATFFAAYLVKELGQSNAMAGGLWALVGGLSIFCGVLWGGISDKLGRGRGAALAYFTLAISYLIMALLRMPAGFYLSAVIFGLTAWSIPTIMAAAAGDQVGPSLAPAGLGFITLFFGLGQALGPAVGGYLADAAKSFVLPLLLATAVSLLGSVLAWRLRPRPAKV